jgi:hypothetical protein
MTTLPHALRVHTGLGILLKYDSDGDISFGHDQVWAGPSSEVEISKEDLDLLDKLGWFIDTEVDCWSHF